MTHPADDDLVLHFYRDPSCPPSVAVHLAVCDPCGARYRDLADVLEAVPELDVPERGERYGLEVWQRIRSNLPERELLRGLPWRWRAGLAACACAALLLAVGFVAGRGSLGRGPDAGPVVGEGVHAETTAAEQRRRALLLSVADHLERSDRMLTDVMNAGEAIDLAVERQRAEDLLWAGRLYRQDAIAAGEPSVATMLDDLERTLLDIAHSRSGGDSGELDGVRRRVESAALLFKVRVMRDQLQDDYVVPERQPDRDPGLQAS